MPGPELIGRYALYGSIASGGMATVHIGRLLGPVGFARTVAIKRMHPHLAQDPELVSMLLDEARLAARIRHPNVVPTVDVIASSGELFVVMEYVCGETLSRLAREADGRSRVIPTPIAAAILSGALHGLHAAHEATNEQGEPLGIVHRDVSPQNILVGLDGTARVLDFGVAKATGRLQTTRDGQVKGKLAYMAPEQLSGERVTRRCDLYAASVVLWEALAGRRLFRGDSDASLVQHVLTGRVDPPSAFAAGIPAALDALVMRGLSRDPHARFTTAREMGTALEASVPLALTREVGEWVEETAGEALAAQAARVAQVERESEHAAGKGPRRSARAHRGLPLEQLPAELVSRQRFAPAGARGEHTGAATESTVLSTVSLGASAAAHRRAGPVALAAVAVAAMAAAAFAWLALSPAPAPTTRPVAGGAAVGSIAAAVAPLDPAMDLPAVTAAPPATTPPSPAGVASATLQAGTKPQGRAGPLSSTKRQPRPSAYNPRDHL